MLNPRVSDSRADIGLSGGELVVADLSGFGSIRTAHDQVARLRKAPGLSADQAMPTGFLKHADDQTVVSIAAMCRAMSVLARPTASFADWGVVAAPNLFGRLATHQGLVNYWREGAWGASPHMIPHQSLHAVSGTVSQLFRIHGPNFGVSGGPRAVTEAFLAAATLISENNLPGLWVLLSGHVTECLPNQDNKNPATHPDCLAVALALEPRRTGLKPVLPSGTGFKPVLQVSGAPGPYANWPEFSLVAFVAVLEGDVPTGRWQLPGCGSLFMGARP